MPKRGQKQTAESNEKNRLAHLGKPTGRTGEKHPLWKADKVTYNPLHTWVKRHLPKPDLCERCELVPPFDLANITGVYNREFKNWRYYCRRCHMESDGRLDHVRKWKIIDMISRNCTNCGSDKTWIKKNGRPQWRHFNNKLVCNICHKRLSRMR